MTFAPRMHTSPSTTSLSESKSRMRISTPWPIPTVPGLRCALGRQIWNVWTKSQQRTLPGGRGFEVIWCAASVICQTRQRSSFPVEESTNGVCFEDRRLLTASAVASVVSDEERTLNAFSTSP